MGQSKLLAVGSALSAALLPLCAQGPVYRERWGYQHLERLRAEVWAELAGRDATIRRRVAELLVAVDGGVPCLPPARALALLRGVEADAAFALRASVSVYVLPEVCDPVGKNEVCRQANLSVFLPFSLPSPGALAFQIEVRDRAGASVFRTMLTEATGIDDLRMARPAASVPCGELADGRYEATVRTFVDGKAPAASDPVLRVAFHVLRGYQERSEAAMQAAAAAGGSMPALARALLDGIAAEVSRAYLGEAFDVQSEAVQDLARLEAALANIAAGRHVLHGMQGEIATALPAGDGRILCVLRPAAAGAGEAQAPGLPIVVFAGSAPSYDVAATRPSAPATRGPRWLHSELRAFGAGRPWHVACLESPGGGRNYAADLPAALRALRELWSAPTQPLVLVCDREAAAVAGLATSALAAEASALVLVGAGGMPAAAIDTLGSWPVRLGPVRGHVSSDGLQRVLDYVDRKRRDGQWRGDLDRLAGEPPPWVFGLPAYADAIAAFTAEVVKR